MRSFIILAFALVLLVALVESSAIENVNEVGRVDTSFGKSCHNLTLFAVKKFNSKKSKILILIKVITEIEINHNKNSIKFLMKHVLILKLTLKQKCALNLKNDNFQLNITCNLLIPRAVGV